MWLGRERGVLPLTDEQNNFTVEERETAERMRAIVEEEGLEKVEDDAIKLMQAGLHAHLLRLMRSAVPVQEVAPQVRTKELLVFY
jgi:hypothetical protein